MSIHQIPLSLLIIFVDFISKSIAVMADLPIVFKNMNAYSPFSHFKAIKNFIKR